MRTITRQSATRSIGIAAGPTGSIIAAVLVLVVSVALPHSTLAAGTASQSAPWLDADGRPLPFRSDDEVLEFLRTAAVTAREALPDGVTHPQKLTLEQNGVRTHAIFRSYERTQERALDPITGRPLYDDFTDSAMAEVAAYELARMLELSFVPPTVRKTIDNREGTLQLWIENALTAGEIHERGQVPPHLDWWRGVSQTLAIFDNLVFNTDRHAGNLLIGDGWGVWFIDHTRAFQRRRELRNPESIEFIQLQLWQRLENLPDEEIRARLAPYLGSPEIMALLARRNKLVRRIEELIEERGEHAVLFDYSYDLGAWGH